MLDCDLLLMRIVERWVPRICGTVPEEDANPSFKEWVMTTIARKPLSTLYVDRSTKQWIVRDAEGKFWIVPGDDRVPGNQHEPFLPTEGTELELVPGHYKHMLGISN